MKKVLFSSIVVSIILLQACSSSKKATTTTTASEEIYYSMKLTPTIDGKVNEWGDTLLVDKATKYNYAIANDDSTLYIAFKTTEPMQQMKMVQGGMEVWIDNMGTKKKSTGVKFPIGGGRMERAAQGSAGGGQDPTLRRQQMKLQMLKMELKGFKSDLNGTHEVYGDNLVIKPVIDWDEKGNMVYELAIPFTAFDVSVQENLNTISVGIIMKGLKLDQGGGGGAPGGGGGMPGGGGGRPGGGGGRPSGGGPPGGGAGPGGGGSDQMANMTKDVGFWTKYTIAK